LINSKTLLLCKKKFVNINRTCVFTFIFNIYTKSSNISAIKNIRYALIYINSNKDNNNKKEVISFCAITLITSIIRKYRDCILNLTSREFIFFSSSNTSNIN
jgi:hypothetical protein